MGRPPLKQTGPMTAAERQAKYRKRLRKSINRRARTTYKLVKEAPNREATRLKREVWNAALPADEEHFDYRVGDCREKLADIPDNSVALILTDPPYEDSAEPLWQWLGSFAKRVLVPGGAIVCYFGGVRLNKLYRIFDDAGLDHWAPGVMLHGPRQRLWGIGVLMNHKNIVCYTKGPRRLNSAGQLTMVPSVVNSKHDKSLHEWAQGDGGVWQWIFHLTEPGEVVLDPFAGPGAWGKIVWERNRHWIGCDIVKGGMTKVLA